MIREAMNGIEATLRLSAPFLVSYGAVILPTAAVCFLLAYLFNHRGKPGGRRRDGSVEGSDEDGADVSHPSPPENAEAVHIPYRPDVYSHEDMLQRSSTFLELMDKRRSVRFFSDRPIPRTIIENIVCAAGTV